jgi:hypothetical protein
MPQQHVVTAASVIGTSGQNQWSTDAAVLHEMLCACTAGAYRVSLLTLLVTTLICLRWFEG